MTEYFVILTVQKAFGPGVVELRTVKFAARVGQHATRVSIFEEALRKLPREWQNAMVLFFGAEPNQLVTSPVVAS